MNDEPSTEHGYELTAWIVMAAVDLVAPARQRIREEIEAHYAEAVTGFVAEGLSRVNAESRALLELGDSQVAAKGFRKRYLTQDEERWLQDRIRWKWGGGRWAAGTSLGMLILITVLTFCFVTGIFGWPRHGLPDFVRFSWISNWFFMASLIWCQYRAARLRQRPLPEHELRQKLLTLDLAECLYMPLFITGMVLTDILISGRASWMFFGVALTGLASAVGILLASRRFRVWRKLRYEQIASGRGVEA